MSYRYPLAQDTIDDSDFEALREWLLTKPQLTKGPLTPKMEQTWANWVGKKYAVFCNSGSSANLLAAFALKYSNKLKNNKVIICDVGWVTTISPFMQAGFDITLCGTDKNNFGIDLEQLETLCAEINPAVVVFVQPLGVLVDKNRLLALQMKYGFILINDSCAALGSKYSDGTNCAVLGDMSTFSLFYSHQASTIEGGLIFTDDKLFYNILISLRSHGWLRDLEEDVLNGIIEQNHIDNFNKPFTFVYPGFNVRATDLQAFIGLRQIKKIDYFANIRDRNHKLYASILSDKMKIQNFDCNEKISSISFAMLAKSSQERKNIIENLLKNKIECRLYSAGALHRHEFLRDKCNNFYDEISNNIHDFGFFVPNNHSLSEDDVRFISNVILEVL